MIENYRQLKSYQSDKKHVALINYEGGRAILKLSEDGQKSAREADLMTKVSYTGYAPKVLSRYDNYFICEYIEGEDFLQEFLDGTMIDDVEKLEALAGKLAIFMQMFHSVCSGYILGNIDFGNFVIKDGRCIGVSYDGVTEGLPYRDVAEVIAFAITRAHGGFYSCFPFVSKFLECFHLEAMDVVNDLSDALEKYDPASRLDKHAVTEALISFEEKGTAWKIINNE
ncbi:MAG: hypothetical protein ACI4MI_06010 [Christensenellales bacterium]